MHSQTKKADPLDGSSRKRIFGWVTIDGKNIPYILRGETKYVSVRMVEMQLLSQFPSTYPEELKTRPPLTSQYITLYEVALLNEINTQHCNMEYGTQNFTSQDLIVALNDFLEFYRVVKESFPSASPEVPNPEGGWVQVNNTLVPFVIRKGIKMVPLPVLKYGANLLNSSQITGVESSEREIDFLNRSCQKISLNFTFTRTMTTLLEVSLIPTLCKAKVVITELPKDDPFGHAQYLTEKDIEQPSPLYPTAMQDFNSMRGKQHSSMTNSASTQWMGPHMGVFHSAPVSQTVSTPPQMTYPRRASPSSNVLDLTSRMSPNSHPQNQNSELKKLISSAPASQSKPDYRVPANVKPIYSNEGREVAYLQSTKFHNKRITCILKDGCAYALVESLNRLFFQHCPLDRFIGILRNLTLDIKDLLPEEEQAFIKHYELQIRRLRCSKIVNLKDIDSNMAKMTSNTKAFEPSPISSPKSDSDSMTDDHSISPAARQALKNHIAKRSPPSDSQQPPAKKKNVKKIGMLENIMNKLMKAKMDDSIALQHKEDQLVPAEQQVPSNQDQGDQTDTSSCSGLSESQLSNDLADESCEVNEMGETGPILATETSSNESSSLQNPEQTSTLCSNDKEPIDDVSDVSSAQDKDADENTDEQKMNLISSESLHEMETTNSDEITKEDRVTVSTDGDKDINNELEEAKLVNQSDKTDSLQDSSCELISTDIDPNANEDKVQCMNGVSPPDPMTTGMDSDLDTGAICVETPTSTESVLAQMNDMLEKLDAD